jgi:8-hydroxy-5-deazaflavin:NADPH oxidoreductase
MRVGILGSDLMGGKLGMIFARAGHALVFSYARREEKLRQLARAAGGNARAGTPREAAQDADALLLAVNWSRVDDVMHQAGDRLADPGNGLISGLLTFLFCSATPIADL